MKTALARWALQVAIALDQLACTLFGGWADETCSSFLYRLDLKGKPAGRLLRPVVDWIAWHVFGQADHCRKSYEAERDRSQCPPELRVNTPRGLSAIPTTPTTPPQP